MESLEAAKILYDRILKTESHNVARKIIGYIYLQNHPDHEIIRLAFGPDNLINNMTQKAKIDLDLAPKPVPSPPESPSLQFVPIPLRSPRPLPSPVGLQSPPPVPHWDPPLAHRVQDQFNGLGDHFESLVQEISSFPGNYSYPESPVENFRTRGRRQELSVKVCHYFNKGHCKHGNSCKFFHGQTSPESCYPRMSDFDVGIDEEAAFSPGSLEKLEFEITEILRSKRGNPVSIASLPMMYYERYGKTLQAEGYLTESQRHGKAGYSLTRLLARLNNSIQLIGSCRPHGQHSVILAEDVPKYIENNRYERNNPGPIITGSKQIYLTFPAESTFTEDDVASYFSTFGPVEDVRIPGQQKRMFGFVTFAYAETVEIILSKGNPHYVSGARVLVKPYREKSRVFGRKHLVKIEAPIGYHSHHNDMDPNFQAGLEPPRFRRQLMEERRAQLEVMHQLSQLHLLEGLPHQSFFDSDDQNFPEGAVMSYARANYTDHENNEGRNPPNNPFSSPKWSSKDL